MSSENAEAEKPNLRFDVVTALVYSVLLVLCTVVIQNLVHGYLDQYAKYVGAFIISIFTFFFAMFFGSIGKAVINFAMRKRFLSKRFVIFAVIFTILICAICSSQLVIWWASAIMGALGIVITFFKVLFKREVKKRISAVRNMESDLRHKSFDRAEDVFNKFRGKR